MIGQHAYRQFIDKGTIYIEKHHFTGVCGHRWLNGYCDTAIVHRHRVDAAAVYRQFYWRQFGDGKRVAEVQYLESILLNVGDKQAFAACVIRRNFSGCISTRFDKEAAEVLKLHFVAGLCRRNGGIVIVDQNGHTGDHTGIGVHQIGEFKHQVVAVALIVVVDDGHGNGLWIGRACGEGHH